MPASPWLLAIESATRCVSVAVLRGETLQAGCAADERRDPARSLLPLVDEALGKAGVSLDAIEAFALTIGPGSFTSLRVGLASVKGLSFGTGRPVAPVSTLAALALGARLSSSNPGASEVPIAALLDARRNPVYAAVYRTADDGGIEPIEVVPEAVYAIAELAEKLDALGPRCSLVGEGAALYAPDLETLRGSAVEISPLTAEPVGAYAVGLLGARRLARGEGVPAAELVPHYLLRTEAEQQRLASLGDD